jgi:hypothetical protein
VGGSGSLGFVFQPLGYGVGEPSHAPGDLWRNVAKFVGCGGEFVGGCHGSP